MSSNAEVETPRFFAKTSFYLINKLKFMINPLEDSTYRAVKEDLCSEEGVVLAEITLIKDKKKLDAIV